MYICLCHGFTEREVTAAVAGGCRSVAEVYRQLGGPPQCGKCTSDVRTMVKGRRCPANTPPARPALTLAE